MRTNQQQEPVELWRIAEVVRRTGLGERTIYRLVSTGKFPRPRKVPGARRHGWLSTEVVQFLRALPA